MHIVERFWGVVASIFSIVSLSPLQDGIDTQSPLPLPSQVITIQSPLTSSAGVVPSVDVPKGPGFVPPGSFFQEPFHCYYPEMVGWEPCTNESRKCWLRRKSDGKQYDINTNYEEDAPIGITRLYKLDLKDSNYDADGMPFDKAKLFDERYPGKWIQACWGDTVEVTVINSLKHQGTSIHWHGIRQNQTMHMDGVNGVTQCPIAKDDSFVYKFKVTQYGTSWYHSHYSVQYADGAVGPITIHGPSSADYDEPVSFPLIMTDWGHNSAFEAVNTGILKNEDILLNGLGNVTRFDNKTPNETTIKDPFQITFEGPQPGQRNKKYHLQIINTSFDTTFKFTIDNHLLQIASADFVPIQPYTKDSVLVGIGQRYNVIVEANPLVHNDTDHLPEDGNYWIRTYIAPCRFDSNKCLGPNNASCGYERTGILRYNSTSKANPSSKPWSELSFDCKDEDYAVLRPILPWNVRRPANNRFGDNYGEIFDLAFGNSNPPPYPLAKWTLSKQSSNQSEGQGYDPIRVDYKDPTFLHLDNHDPWPPLWRIIPEDYTSKDWVYLVIKGRQGRTGAHPIHLHGHDFALLEQAYNKTFNSSNVSVNYDNPPRRDVVLVPKNGYVIIAFKADNPGAWLVHCHIAFHISEGLGLQILERQGDANSIWPPGDSAIEETKRVCTNWDKWYKNRDNWEESARECAKTNDPAECFQNDSGV